METREYSRYVRTMPKTAEDRSDKASMDLVASMLQGTFHEFYRIADASRICSVPVFSTVIHNGVTDIIEKVDELLKQVDALRYSIVVEKENE